MARPRTKTVKVVCNLSQENYNWTEELLGKKLEYYGTPENLEKYFIQAKFVRLISKGKNIQDIANFYGLNYEMERKEYYEELRKFHLERNKNTPMVISEGSSTTVIETDDDVVEFLDAWEDFNG